MKTHTDVSYIETQLRLINNKLNKLFAWVLAMLIFIVIGVALIGRKMGGF